MTPSPNTAQGLRGWRGCLGCRVLISSELASVPVCILQRVPVFSEMLLPVQPGTPLQVCSQPLYPERVPEWVYSVENHPLLWDTRPWKAG